MFAEYECPPLTCRIQLVYSIFWVWMEVSKCWVSEITTRSYGHFSWIWILGWRHCGFILMSQNSRKLIMYLSVCLILNLNCEFECKCIYQYDWTDAYLSKKRKKNHAKVGKWRYRISLVCPLWKYNLWLQTKYLNFVLVSNSKIITQFGLLFM